MAPALPAFAPFPESPAWRELLPPAEWAACLDSWLSLARAHLVRSEADFAALSLPDESIPPFLRSSLHGLVVQGPSALGDSPTAAALKKASYLLAARLLRSPQAPSSLLQWEFVSDFCHVYGKRRAAQALAALPTQSADRLALSLQGLKKSLVTDLDSGLRGDLRSVEGRLRRVNYLISAWPPAAALFLAGSDYFDGLVSCFEIMNPPLRKCIVTNLYLCLVGLAEGAAPKFSLLTDVLYSLREAAEEHKKGPLNANDSLVAELVTATPVLLQLERRAADKGASTARIVHVLRDLTQFHKAGGRPPKPNRPTRAMKATKGKGKAAGTDGASQPSQPPHAHRWSQISQIQDLFPDLGSAFVVKLLDEYDDDSEQVIAHLLEGTLPEHLETADRAENLPSSQAVDAQHNHIAPRPTPPLLPTRHTLYDDDDLTKLAADTSRLHFGKQKSTATANDLLRDRSKAPSKAAVLSALAAFDSDDDERDDTYDAVDVGGTVDNAAAHGDDLENAKEEALFAAYQALPQAFDRDSTTRRSEARSRLRDETGMTDEAIEGWGLMLSRNPQQRRRLEARFTAFSGAQTELGRTAWREGEQNSGDSGTDGPSHRGGGRGRGRGGRGRGNRGGGGGNVANAPGEKGTEQARRRKEANKSSRANHNRRDQRARKMARGGFPG